jgi:CBS domain-containing protein
MKCPACGTQNLEGADECEKCLTPLTQVQMQTPAKRGDIRERLAKEIVGSIRPAEPLWLTPGDSLEDALDLMKKKNIGCLLIREKGNLVGIFTERDALTKLGRSTIDLKKNKIQDYMTPNPEVLEVHHSVAYALNKMSVGGYRHLPLRNGQEIKGVISIREILHYFWG